MRVSIQQSKSIGLHVDHEDALDGVSVDVAEDFDFEVAQRHPREVSRLLPLPTVHLEIR